MLLKRKLAAVAITATMAAGTVAFAATPAFADSTQTHINNIRVANNIKGDCNALVNLFCGNTLGGTPD